MNWRMEIYYKNHTRVVFFRTLDEAYAEESRLYDEDSEVLDISIFEN